MKMQSMTDMSRESSLSIFDNAISAAIVIRIGNIMLKIPLFLRTVWDLSSNIVPASLTDLKYPDNRTNDTARHAEYVADDNKKYEKFSLADIPRIARIILGTEAFVIEIAIAAAMPSTAYKAKQSINALQTLSAFVNKSFIS